MQNKIDHILNLEDNRKKEKKKKIIHEFHESCHFVTSHCTGQFTPKMKANAEPRLLSSLV